MLRTFTIFLALMSPAFAAGTKGILLLAHGGNQKWNDAVQNIANKTNESMPTEVALGMATRRSIQEGVQKLAARGVTEIVAVPLFVRSHSSVIDSTAYLLGLRPDAPEDLKAFAAMDHGSHGAAHKTDTGSIGENTKPVLSSVPVRMTEALNHNAVVAAILLDRAASISTQPSREAVLLVAHGPAPEEENGQWLADMKLIAAEMKKSSAYSEIEYLTVRDDADEPVRNAATKELRERVEKLRGQGKSVLVVPLLLSYGGIENGIKRRLEGLEYKIPAQGLLPDSRIAGWVLSMAAAAGAH